jgi:hypothetical protein
MIHTDGTRIHFFRGRHEQEKTNAKEYADDHSGNDPDGDEVKEDTDRKSPRSAVRC